MIYFDNAATTGKKPQCVINAVNNTLKCHCANPGRSGHEASRKAAMIIYDVREKISDMFGANGVESVVFTSNCTHSINCVIKGVVKENDHIVISDLEHNAVVRPIYKIGVDYSVAKVSFEDDEETFNNFVSAVKENTKLVICTAGSNVFGKILPIKRIGEFCRENNILFAVDAAQTAGIIPIDMEKMKIDYLCIAPHKGLYAPMGIGILICKREIENTLIEGGTGTDSVNHFQPDFLPERLESGTLNLPAVAGIGAGIDFVKSYGIDKIYNHEIKIISHLYNNLSKIDGVRLYTPYPKKEMFAPVLCFNIDGVHSEKVAQYLNRKGIAVRAGLHCAPLAHEKMGTLNSGTVRICPSVFNDLGEANYLLRAVKCFI